jgi:hypothetical protein
MAAGAGDVQVGSGADMAALRAAFDRDGIIVVPGFASEGPTLVATVTRLVL